MKKERGQKVTGIPVRIVSDLRVVGNVLEQPVILYSLLLLTC